MRRLLLLQVTLPYLTLPHLTLPYLTLLYPTLPYLTLPYLTLPYLTLPYLTYLCRFCNYDKGSDDADKPFSFLPSNMLRKVTPLKPVDCC